MEPENQMEEIRAMNEIEEALLRSRPRTSAAQAARATNGLASRAVDEGLLDVAYAAVDSPFGELTVAATPRGLVRIAYPSASSDAVLEDLAQRLSPRLLEAPARLDPARRELDEYFAGRRKAFGLEIDWSLTRGFFRRVLRATAAIPYGEVSSYAEVAADAGSPRAARAAGNGLASNPIPVVVPCHRVLWSGGGLGGYTGGLERKEFLLALEGFLPSWPLADEGGSRGSRPDPPMVRHAPQSPISARLSRAASTPTSSQSAAAHTIDGPKERWPSG